MGQIGFVRHSKTLYPYVYYLAWRVTLSTARFGHLLLSTRRRLTPWSDPPDLNGDLHRDRVASTPLLHRANATQVELLSIKSQI